MRKKKFQIHTLGDLAFGLFDFGDFPEKKRELVGNSNRNFLSTIVITSPCDKAVKESDSSDSLMIVGVVLLKFLMKT